MNSWSLRCCVLSVLCASVVNAFSLDREAFTFTNYDLKIQIEPDQHRLGARGKITLRNDSSSPQKIAVVQISSSLNWRSIKAGDKPLQYVTQPYTSDIDHTGALSEAIVTLTDPVLPKSTIELDIAYEGVILLDATRLTRIGAPEARANSSDWDQISAKFTAVRGAGYVAWYPVATEVANLSDPNGVSEVVGRFKRRHAESKMTVVFESTQDSAILFSGTSDLFTIKNEEGISWIAVFDIVRLGMNVPTFVQADFKKLDVKGLQTVNFLPGKESAAQSYADVLNGLDPFPSARGSRRLQVVGLPDPDSASFATESMLLTPLKPTVTEEEKLRLVYALAREENPSPRPWITEGLAHLAQLLEIEQQHGRRAALDYLDAHRKLLVDSEREIASENVSLRHGEPDFAASHSMINTTDEAYLQSKAMWVCWMLHDMIERTGVSMFLHTYEAGSDKEPSYAQKVFEKPARRDLEWFFDDWVYRDRGLPDFKVESAFPRKTMTGTYMVTVTVDNLGAAGAEVPVTVKFSGGELTKRLEVRGKNKGVIRVEVPSAPQEIVVNDGSVPENDMTNNAFKIEAADTSK